MRRTAGRAREARPTRRLGRGAAGSLLAALVLLTACTPLYLPPVPEPMPPLEPTLRLERVRVDLLGGAPAVAFVPREVPEPGWAAVQWFPPAGAEVASSSVWLDEDRIGRVVRVAVPGDVQRDAPGRWRAVLSFDGRILRQLEWREPAGP